MGANFSYSRNVTDSIVRSGITAAVAFTQICASRIQNNQTITLQNCTLNAQSIDIENVQIGVIKCASDASNQENIQNAVEQAIRQSAQTASQQLGILDLGRVSVNESVNIAKVEADLATTITTSFTQVCTPQLESNQNITCINSTINTGPLVLSNYQQSLVDCTFRAVSQSEAYNQLQQIVSQSAVAKEESIFSVYVVIGLVAIAITAIIVLNSKRNIVAAGNRSVGASRNTWLVIGIVIVICIVIVGYAAFASSNGWWPFRRNTSGVGTGYAVR
jgi:hypothetical protein